MSAVISNDQLRSVLGSVLDAKPERIKIERQKTTQINTVFHIKMGKDKYILLIAPPQEQALLFNEQGMMRQLPYLHSLIQAKTDIPILNIVFFDFEGKWLNRDFVLLAQPTGKSFAETDTFNHAQHNWVLGQIGHFLSQLHAIDGKQFGYQSNYQPLTPQLSWKNTFELLWLGLIEDLAHYKCYTSAKADKFKQVWQANKAHFSHTISPALLRLEAWDEFVWVDKKGNITGVYGFERALWGDPELDFAVLDYCGIYASSVWESYGTPRPNTPESQVRRKIYLLYEIQRHILADDNENDGGLSKQMALTMLNSLIDS